MKEKESKPVRTVQTMQKVSMSDAPQFIDNRTTSSQINKLKNGMSEMRIIRQMKMDFTPPTDLLDEAKGDFPNLYRNIQKTAKGLGHDIFVKEGETAVGAATYTPTKNMREGIIVVQNVKETFETKDNVKKNKLLATMSHETQHAIDDLSKTVKYRNGGDNLIRTEWRAWAAEAAVLYQNYDNLNTNEFLLINSFESKHDFSRKSSYTFGRTSAYLKHYKIINVASDEDVSSWINNHREWVDEAVVYFYSLITPKTVVDAWPDKGLNSDSTNYLELEEVY